MDKKRIGFFGGCFNPPTFAHINLIKELIENEKLDKVYFVPMNDYYQKEELISFKHRKNMLNLALKSEEKMEVLDILEKEKDITYAIDTFNKIDVLFKEYDRFFIMGSDNYEKLDTWKDSDKLKKYNYIILERKPKSISSRNVRLRIKNKESIEELVSEDVEKYIIENKLYV